MMKPVDTTPMKLNQFGYPAQPGSRDYSRGPGPAHDGTGPPRLASHSWIHSKSGIRMNTQIHESRVDSNVVVSNGAYLFRVWLREYAFVGRWADLRGIGQVIVDKDALVPSRSEIVAGSCAGPVVIGKGFTHHSPPIYIKWQEAEPLIVRPESTLTLGPFGSMNRATTFVIHKGEIYVTCGCWSGTINAFRDRIDEVYGDESIPDGDMPMSNRWVGLSKPHAAEYQLAADLAERWADQVLEVW